MNNAIVLSRQLKKARHKRGWTVGFAASRTPSVGRGTLINLESGKTDPEHCQVKTAMQLIDLFYPDVVIGDFVGFESLGEVVVTRRMPNGGS